MNKLAKKRKLLEKEIEKRAGEVKEYFLENTGVYAHVKLGNTTNTLRHAINTNLCQNEEYVDTQMTDIEIVKNEIKIKKIINEINVKSIKEMREALDEANG